MAPGPLEELDGRLKEAADSGEVPGLAYAILKDGKLVRARAFGVSDVETHRPWRFDTICRLYSMTKSVAVCGLMGLVEDGLVSLSDPVSKFLPAFAAERLLVVADDSVVHASPSDAAPKAEITVQHLLVHCSGLSYGPALGDDPSCATEEAYQPLIRSVDRGAVPDLEHWCAQLAKLPLRFQPGERWEYSYGIDVIGRIIEVASGQRLDAFLRERVLSPLGMEDTTFALPEDKRDRLASFYRRQEEGSSPVRLQRVDGPTESLWVEPHQQRVLSAGGTVGSIAGGLVSTLNDFARLCLMLQNGGELDGVRVLRPETVQLMSTNLLPEMTGRPDSWCLDTAGLGFGILGSVAVSHAEANWYDVPGEVGWGGLAGTAWAADHRERLVVLSFCQVMYELWIDEEVRKAARRALGHSPAASEAVAAAAAPEAAQAAPTTPSGAEALAPAVSGASPAAALHPATAVTPSSKAAASKREPEAQAIQQDETPKRARHSSEAFSSLGSTEKFKQDAFALQPLPGALLTAAK